MFFNEEPTFIRRYGFPESMSQYLAVCIFTHREVRAGCHGLKSRNLIGLIRAELKDLSRFEHVRIRSEHSKAHLRITNFVHATTHERLVSTSGSGPPCATTTTPKHPISQQLFIQPRSNLLRRISPAYMQIRCRRDRSYLAASSNTPDRMQRLA